MKKILLSALTLITTVNVYANEPLPNWIDHSREKIVAPLEISKGESAPPSGFRLPAEYEPAQAVSIGNMAFTPMLQEIATAVVGSGTEIWISGEELNLNVKNKSLVKQLGCALDTVWMRDYGPVGITESGDLAIVDSIYRHYQYRVSDDHAPECIANNFSLINFNMPIILDGGNLMVDSVGNLFMTKITYKWNNKMSAEKINETLKEYFGVHTIHAIDYAGIPGNPLDGTGHIDMFVKLLNDETVLISQTTSPGFKEATENAVKYFKSIKTPSGNDYKILRTPGWSNGRTWYTYTNSLIVNNLALVPKFSGHDEDNKTAERAYVNGNPNLSVKMIDSDQSIIYGGSIHCVTQLIPKK